MAERDTPPGAVEVPVDSEAKEPVEPVPATTSPDTAHFRAYAKRDPYLAAFKAVYFTGMGAGAAYYPFVVMMLTRQDSGPRLDSLQAGLILSLSHLLTMVVSPILGSLADRSATHRKGVMLATTAASVTCAYLMGHTRTFWEALAAQCGMDSLGSALYVIVDASVMATLEATEGHSKNYGNSRAFGALGWGLWAWVAGAIFDKLSLNAMFVTYVLSTLPLYPLIWIIPVEKRSSLSLAKAGGEGKVAMWRRILKLDVVVFLIVVYITATLLAVVDVFRTPFLASLGASNQLLGFSITMTAASEFPFFFIASAVLKRVSTPLILLFVLAIYVLRMATYSILEDPWWTIPNELLHGVTFALGWSASTAYMAALLPPELSSTAQSILASIQWGIGSATGCFLGGAITDRWGARVMFQCCAVLAGVGCAIMAWSMHHTRTTLKATRLEDESTDSSGDAAEKTEKASAVEHAGSNSSGSVFASGDGRAAAAAAEAEAEDVEVLPKPS